MKKQHRKNGAAMRLLFVCYGAVMIYLLFIRGRSTSGSAATYWLRVMNNYNLDPMHTVRSYWDILARPEYYISKFGTAAAYEKQVRFAFINLAGNVLMFVPLGIFLPAIWQKLQRWWKTMLMSTGVIVLVELTQLLSLRGSCDVDDLILNLCGVLMGYVLWRIVHFFCRKRR